MAYTPTNWAQDMVIGATNLNNLETGVKQANDAIITGGTLNLSSAGAPTAMTLTREDGTTITVTIVPAESAPTAKTTRSTKK